MATVYASANDGFIKSHGTSSWDAIRNATSGSVDSTTATGSLAISAAVFAGRGTTIIASTKKGRNIIAAEIDEDTYNIAKGNLWQGENKQIQEI